MRGASAPLGGDSPLTFHNVLDKASYQIKQSTDSNERWDDRCKGKKESDNSSSYPSPTSPSGSLSASREGERKLKKRYAMGREREAD